MVDNYNFLDLRSYKDANCSKDSQRRIMEKAFWGPRQRVRYFYWNRQFTAIHSMMYGCEGWTTTTVIGKEWIPLSYNAGKTSCSLERKRVPIVLY